MRGFALPLLGFLLVAVAGCGRTSEQGPAVPDASPPVAPEVVAEPQAPVASETSEAPAPRADKPVDYFDDRSTAENLIRSYYNAINRHEYSRAFNYWRSGSSVQPYEKFKQGFAETDAVTVELGTIVHDAGAGQRWAAVPTSLTVRKTDGSQQFFGGCYVTHISAPEIQDTENFVPMGIERARMTQTGSIAAARQVMGKACDE